MANLALRPDGKLPDVSQLYTSELIRAAVALGAAAVPVEFTAPGTVPPSGFSAKPVDCAKDITSSCNWVKR